MNAKNLILFHLSHLSQSNYGSLHLGNKESRVWAGGAFSSTPGPPRPPRQSLRLTRKVIKSLKRKWAGETDCLPTVSFLCIPNSRHTALHPFHILAHVTLAMSKAKNNRELLSGYCHSKSFKADTLPNILSHSCNVKGGKMIRNRKLLNHLNYHCKTSGFAVTLDNSVI